MTPTVDYHQGFNDESAHAVSYFILHESRNESPQHRSKIIRGVADLFSNNTPMWCELTELELLLQKSSREAARVLASIRSKNAEKLSKNCALQFFIDHLEHEPLHVQFALSGYGELTIGDAEADHTAWAKAWERVQAFERRFDLFLQRLRNDHWAKYRSEKLMPILREVKAAEETERQRKAKAAA
jgi:hypothetical protein